jgi:hypothetical protein
LTPKHRRLPQHEVGELADFHRSDLVRMPCVIAGLIVYFAM